MYGKQCTEQKIKRLKGLANENTSIRLIGIRLEQREESIRAETGREGVSLKPTNHTRPTATGFSGCWTGIGCGQRDYPEHGL